MTAYSAGANRSRFTFRIARLLAKLLYNWKGTLPHMIGRL
jgi:hypothetical protein